MWLPVSALIAHPQYLTNDCEVEECHLLSSVNQVIPVGPHVRACRHEAP